jgi:hypothetical protein
VVCSQKKKNYVRSRERERKKRGNKGAERIGFSRASSARSRDNSCHAHARGTASSDNVPVDRGFSPRSAVTIEIKGGDRRACGQLIRAIVHSCVDRSPSYTRACMHGKYVVFLSRCSWIVPPAETAQRPWPAADYFG